MKRTFYRYPYALIVVIAVINLTNPAALPFVPALAMVVALVVASYIGDGLFAVAQGAVAQAAVLARKEGNMR